MWVSPDRRPSRCPRAPTGPHLAVERRGHSNVFQPSTVQGARAGRRDQTRRCCGSAPELALRARLVAPEEGWHRVCRLLGELRPRRTQSAAGPSDRSAGAEGRVCSLGLPRHARHFVPPTARTIAGLVGHGACLDDLSRRVHSSARTAPQATRTLRSVPGTSQSRDRQRHHSASTACLRLRRTRSALREFGGAGLRRRLTPQGGCRLRLPAADCPAWRTRPALRLRCSCVRVWACAWPMRQHGQTATADG